MTDRADELAQQVQRAVLADIAYRIASGQVGPTNQSMPGIVWKQHITAALRAYAEEARREEREANIKTVEARLLYASTDIAAAIRARGEKG